MEFPAQVVADCTRINCHFWSARRGLTAHLRKKTNSFYYTITFLAAPNFQTFRSAYLDRNGRFSKNRGFSKNFFGEMGTLLHSVPSRVRGELKETWEGSASQGSIPSSSCSHLQRVKWIFCNSGLCCSRAAFSAEVTSASAKELVINSW